MMRPGRTTSFLTVCLLAAPAVALAQGRATDRLTTMDRNGDGVVTRQEWTGTADAFNDRDWNRDGRLSGSELRPGARRGQARRSRDEDANRNADQFDDWTPEGFAALDRNRDGRVTESEWTFGRDDFDRADHNGDGTVTRAEFLNEDTSFEQQHSAMAAMDSNRDGQLSRREWSGSSGEFNRRDGNQDGALSGTELNDLDVNGQGTRPRGQAGSVSQNRSRAYQTGSERGRTEGLEAGRQDRERSQGWDLEGQRELETADSGYTSSLGARAEYQAGYREAFRAAYREGYGR